MPKRNCAIVPTVYHQHRTVHFVYQRDVPELVEGLEATGLKPIVIDEHTDFDKLLGNKKEVQEVD